MRPLAALFAVVCVSCAAKQKPSGSPRPGEDPAAAVTSPPEAGGEPSGALGAAGRGFVEGSSANGRLVVVRHWQPGEEPIFGHHGEPSIEPQLVLLDFIAGTAQVYDELIEIGPQRRWLLMIDGDAAVLIDSQDGSQQVLDGADTRSDGNRCLPPRAAAFGFGALPRVAWVGTEGALQVWDLSTDARWSVRSTGRIWRGWPDSESQDAYFLRVGLDSEGWPQQNTSCACRWCNRFALSYGVYGWSGPAFSVVRAGPGGEQQTDSLPQGDWSWHGDRDDGCALVPAATDGHLDIGPWRWDC